MKIVKRNRKFLVGKNKNITLKDIGSIFLNNNENITFKTLKNQKEYDICKKSWGFYATPSLNKRLIKFGYNAALVTSKDFNTYAILIVEKEKKKSFFKYLISQNMFLICWLNNSNLSKIKKYFKNKK